MGTPGSASGLGKRTGGNAGTAPQADSTSPWERLRLSAIEATYPGWRILVRDGLWWATKYTPPTEEQKACGMLHQFARPGPDELVAALNVQLGILARMGAA
ncbi:hypothetical protein DP939_22530 [Spongiactinospora rosea]|uniref:Uncharacterized protein n=1 Tax=Spongiactinospora rosea TaxID=2248750 RepID=A0A366LWF4_9ACTN|nr:hypothetical protein [Spongiactinospora rosea]RBQ17654.1 hypothetical protein DP939_22530 [Spongiactinospora rosea]